jgi:phosphoglycerate kinase
MKRIDAIMPTIKKIMERGAKQINIICHLGRPVGVESNLSTLILAEEIRRRLRTKGGIIKTDNDYKSPSLKISYRVYKNIELFENLRFDKREEENSEQFAKELAELGDVFVLDAFANIHRRHASMDKLQDQLETFAGLLMEREINSLFKILYAPERPFVSVIGGAKYTDKIPVIRSLSKICEAVLVGGKTANEMILEKEEKIANVFLPSDGINKAGALVDVSPEEIKKGIFDIGPKTIMHFKSILSSAKTIFFNGNLGMTENKKFIHGTNEISRFITKMKVEAVASGGNTTDIVYDLGLEGRFSFISTGGGATSDLISGKKLPVLDKLLK